MTDDGDVTIEMPEQNYEGELEKFTVQTNSRIKLPEEWLESLDLGIGDSVAIAHEGDHIKVFEWDRGKITDIPD